MLGLPERLYWELEPGEYADLVYMHRRSLEARETRERERLQWTAGRALEFVLFALGAKKRDGRSWEPADFFDLPTRAEFGVVAEGENPAGRQVMQMMALITIATGGKVPQHILEGLKGEGVK